MTGTGKTSFTRDLIRFLRREYPALRTYVLDSKAIGDFDDLRGVIRSEEPPDALRTAGAIQVWQPPDDNRDHYNAWFERILHARKPALVVVDELSSIVGERGDRTPIGFAKLQKQGRGLDISVISLTQEAHYIPRTILGQATHLIRFRLEDERDAAKVDRKLGRDRADWGTNPDRQYGMFYRRILPPTPVAYFRDWRDFFRGDDHA